VQIVLWLPPAVAFLVSFFTSMVGVSGAFLLLPFQVSVLHYTAPSVSATNLVFNLVATPGGVYRYWREGRLLWPLLWLLALGTLPGVVVGFYLRVHYLADPRDFRLFVALVLLYLAYRVSRQALGRPGGRAPAPARQAEDSSGDRRNTPALGRGFSRPAVFALALGVGVAGGAYGIGGGSLVAPVLVGLFRLPVHAVAGAALAATFLGSLLGVASYSLLPAPPGVETAPDWLLGGLFGLGGLAGSYAGARLQRRVPARPLEVGLAGVLVLLGAAYLMQWLRA
jgi:hypothetical protein